MTIKIYEALDIINIHVSEGVEIAPNQLYRIDEKYIKLNDLRGTDKLSVEKLQEQLNTAKKALTEIAEIIDDNIHECNYGCDNSCELNGSLDMYSVENVQLVINSALAVIGGDDED